MSPKYELGGQTFKRKHFYMPCVINRRLDQMSDEERAAVYKATYWSDNIAESEWPVVLQDENCTPYAKSRLKKKAKGWLMASRPDRLSQSRTLCRHDAIR